MWDMRHGTSIIQVRILDKDWLDKFQSRRINIRPGDSIRAKVRISHRYDFDGELISTHYDAVEILEVIHTPNHDQSSMFGESTSE